MSDSMRTVHEEARPYPEREARSQVKLKRDASVVFGLQGAIGCPDPSLVSPWRLFPRASLGGWKIL